MLICAAYHISHSSRHQEPGINSEMTQFFMKKIKSGAASGDARLNPSDRTGFFINDITPSNDSPEKIVFVIIWEA
jgi:hypothetical protein